MTLPKSVPCLPQRACVLHELDAHAIRPTNVDQSHAFPLAVFNGLRLRGWYPASFGHTRECGVHIFDIEREWTEPTSQERGLMTLRSAGA